MPHGDIKSDLEQHHKDCYGWALHCCNHNRDLAQEVLQTSYLKMIERQSTFKQRSAFKTWAFSIIKNTAIDAQHNRRRDLRIIETKNNLPDAGYDAGFENEFDKKLTKLFFAEGLLLLSDRQREVLQLVFYHDFTLDQSADVLKISAGSARKHYDRGKKILAKWFQERGIDGSF